MRDLLKHTISQFRVMVAATAVLAVAVGLGLTLAAPAAANASALQSLSLFGATAEPDLAPTDATDAAKAANDSSSSSSSKTDTPNTKSNTNPQNTLPDDAEKKLIEDSRTDADKAAEACPQGECIITSYINPAIKAIAGLTGAFAALGIIIGAIQYAMSGDEPSKVGAAKDRITKSVIVLLAFFLLLAFLNYLVPGGIQK